MSTFDAGKIIADVVLHVTVLERCRSMLRPLGIVGETVSEILALDAGYLPELVALQRALAAALEAAEAVVAVAGTRFDIEYGKGES